MASIKQWLFSGFGFACATLLLFAIYVITIGSDFGDETRLKQTLHRHKLTSGDKDLRKELQGEYEKQRVAEVSKVDFSNSTKTSEVANTQLPRKQDRNQSNGKWAYIKSFFGNSQTELRQKQTTDLPVRTSELQETPDPVYTHHGYVGVLDPKKKLNLHCKQCALVSSSGQLLKSRMGNLIDEADCVFRMNDAPVPKFKVDVGTRTTVRVVGHVASENLRAKRQNLIRISPTKYIVGWGPLKVMSTTGKGYAYNNLKKLAKLFRKVEFFHLTDQQMKKADEIFEAETGRIRAETGTYLSTGWFTMLLARNSCDEIHVYGMVPEKYCMNETNKSVPYHYYAPSGRKECSYYRSNERGAKHSHRFMTEKNIFAKWASEQPPIIFHWPSWNP